MTKLLVHNEVSYSINWHLEISLSGQVEFNNRNRQVFNFIHDINKQKVLPPISSTFFLCIKSAITAQNVTLWRFLLKISSFVMHLNSTVSSIKTWRSIGSVVIIETVTSEA